MSNFIYPATLLADFYKLSHRVQYPKGTEVVYTTWTARSNQYLPEADGAVAFGPQGFIKKYLIHYFNENFFSRLKEDIIKEYARIVKYCLGDQNPDTTHIEELHDLGYLPIRVRAVKEGTVVPIRVPMLTIENTHPKFFWLTNFLETLISNEIWQPMTSATVSRAYRRILDEYAMKTTGSTAGVEFQGHDFSMRGMGSLDTTKTSGAGHLLSFVGTDSIPAILYLEEFYNADVEKEMVGTSIPATEHSVQSANADENQDEMETFKRLLTEIYPTGIFSVVSDTYDFWDNVGRVLPALKDIIMVRDGKIVIRPDSGIPEDMLCGDPSADNELARKGLVECLYDIFGGTVNELGYKVLDPHVGAIYGDSISLERCKTICARLEAKGFASTNVVLGLGSFSFQYRTRDSLGFAMKATDVVINGKEKAIFKDPKTDSGTKKSQKGRVVVFKKENGEIEFRDGLDITAQDSFKSIDLLEDVFLNGELLRDESLADIRAHLASQI